MYTLTANRSSITTGIHLVSVNALLLQIRVKCLNTIYSCTLEAGLRSCDAGASLGAGVLHGALVDHLSVFVGFASGIDKGSGLIINLDDLSGQFF